MSMKRERALLGICFSLVIISLLLLVLSLISVSKESGDMAPSIEINKSQILVYHDYAIINKSSLYYWTVANTGSMKPFVDVGGYVFGINITNVTKLNIGDVITYTSNNNSYIMHRIVDIKQDKNGTYYKVKGDNNNVEDSDKVRLQNMRYKVVGVMY